MQRHELAVCIYKYVRTQKGGRASGADVLHLHRLSSPPPPFPPGSTTLPCARGYQERIAICGCGRGDRRLRVHRVKLRYLQPRRSARPCRRVRKPGVHAQVRGCNHAQTPRRDVGVETRGGGDGRASMWIRRQRTSSVFPSDLHAVGGEGGGGVHDGQAPPPAPLAAHGAKCLRRRRLGRCGRIAHAHLS